MSDPKESFNKTALGLAKNPLGIIALFIVLVYGFASLVTAFSSSFSSEERKPLILFLIGFPILVLIAFCWLVSKHSNKLFAPSDFKNEDNYVKMQLAAVASLTAASFKGPNEKSESSIKSIVDSVHGTSQSAISSIKSQKMILWVDDRPENNSYERDAFESLGISIHISLNTDDALQKLSTQKYSVIISDMGRKEGSREGYVLLDRLRKMGDKTPLIFYASSRAPEHIRETKEHGGQGCTNNAQELYNLVIKEIVNSD